MQINVNGSGYMIGGQAASATYLNNIPSFGNHKYLIQFTNGTIASIKTIDTSNNIIDCTLGTTASDNPYVQISENLLIGCYQNSSGTKGRFWTGTINKFGVWYKQLTEAEINQVFEVQ